MLKQLKLKDARVLDAPYGTLPDLAGFDGSRDLVLVWNGTTSRRPRAERRFHPGEREGLVICDATCAAFAMDLPWDKLDVVTWSWQKVLGGEAAHGMLALSPRAVARLESLHAGLADAEDLPHDQGGKLTEGIFKGETINTPSMLASRTRWTAWMGRERRRP